MPRFATLTTVVACLHVAEALSAQNKSPDIYNDSLLGQIRAAAGATSKDLPTGIDFLKFAEVRPPLSGVVDGGDSTPVTIAFTVFQIRYPKSWIIVDAGFERETWNQFYPKDSVTYWPERWARIQTAFRGADAILLTHEHWDHSGGIERGPQVPDLATKTMVTAEQVASLLDPPSADYIKLPRDSLPAYRTISYATLYRAAPGVVLVRAPGHSPGSQWIYVRLTSGKEFLMVGDLVWNMAGLATGRQRPLAESQRMKEDRDALQRQIDFVRHIMRSGITVITSHDGSALSALAAAGILRDDFDLTH